MTENAKALFEMWCKLDQMCKDGQGESPEADELRDQMDEPWRSLTAEEILQVEDAITDSGRNSLEEVVFDGNTN